MGLGFRALREETWVQGLGRLEERWIYCLGFGALRERVQGLGHLHERWALGSVFNLGHLEERWA